MRKMDQWIRESVARMLDEQSLIMEEFIRDVMFEAETENVDREVFEFVKGALIGATAEIFRSDDSDEYKLLRYIAKRRKYAFGDMPFTISVSVQLEGPYRLEISSSQDHSSQLPLCFTLTDGTYTIEFELSELEALSG